MPEGIPDASRLEMVFSEEFITQTRNSIEGLGKDLDPQPSGTHSRVLNRIIQKARAPEESTQPQHKL